MRFIENQWYGAIWSQDLTEAPVARRILDRPLVLFRTKTGRIAVLDDICPHRFVPLHLGKVIDGESIRCIYHGLEFDSRGACVRNPHNNGRIPPAAKVKSYTAVERHGMVWVWMGRQDSDPALIPDYSILDEADPKLVSRREWLEIRANYMLAAENLLDLSHASILHDGLLGNSEMTNAEVEVEEPQGDLLVKRLMRNVPAPLILDLLYKGDGARVDTWFDIRLMGVACFVNDVGITEPGMGRTGGTGMRGIHVLTPKDDRSTLYHFCAIRVNPPQRSIEEDLAIRAQLSELRTKAFSEQDALVLEAQQAAMLDRSIDTSRPALFDVDLGASRFSRRLDKLLEVDKAAGPATAIRDNEA